MTDFYSNSYQNAGPLARPVIARSQYLADALRAIQAGGQHISSGGELGTRLLAAALTQYAQRRNERQLQNTEAKDAANNPLAQAIMATLPQNNAPPAAPSMAASPEAPATASLGQGSGVGAPGMAPVSNRAAKTNDALVRLLIGEDSNPRGQQAVANVVQNRANTGMDVADVITQPHQFEPYGNQQTWQRLQQIPQTDPRYQQAQAALAASQQQDITGGATNFYGPQTQAALGRQPPAFAQQGGGQMIGGNQFFQGQFAPPAGYQPPPAATPPPQPPQPTADALPPAGAPPAAPAPSINGAAGGMPQGPQTRGWDAVPIEQRQMIAQMLQNPATQQEGERLALQAYQHANAPIHWDVQYNNQTGQTILTDPETGQQRVVDTPGARVAPQFQQQNGGTIAIDPRTLQPTAIPTPQSMQNQPLTPQDVQQRGYVPGTAGQRNPNTGVVTIDQTPPAGYQGPGGAGGNVPMGPSDPHNPAIRVPALSAEQQQLRPTLDEIRTITGSISAVHQGLAQNNGTGDIAAINGLQHLIDAGIVRGEDITLQANANGLPGQFASFVQRVRGQGYLSAEQRAAVRRTAEALFVPRLQSLRSQVESRRGLLDSSYGPGSYDLVVPPPLRQEFGWEPRPGQPGIEEVTRRLQQQMGQVGVHAQQAPHRRVLGVTQVGP